MADTDVAVLGVGMHPWGKWGKNFVEYGVAAIREALADADVDYRDIGFVAGADTMPVDYDFIPRATYCEPQIGSFGWSEQQAKDKGFDVKTATFPFTANGKAMGLWEAIGFVKVVADAEHNEIIGAHMIGPGVTELLPVLTLAQ